MNISLNQLKVFIKVAELESVTKASEELFLTQPAVSIQLKNLEKQFDIPLFELIGRKLYITEFGKNVLESAKTILKETEILKDKMLRHKGLLSGKLNISVVSTGKYVIPYYLSGFLKKNKNIELSMDVTNRSNVLDDLKTNKVDFALVSVMPDDLELNQVELIDNNLYLIGKENPFKNPPSKKQLEKLFYIYREQGSATRLAMENYLKNNDIITNELMQLTSNEAVKQALIAGIGYSIMPIIGIKNELKNGDLSIIPAKNLPIKTKWRLVWLKNKKLSLTAEKLLEYILENLSKINTSNFQ